MEKPEYTVDIHVMRLIMMFGQGNYSGCPAAPGFDPAIEATEAWDEESEPCYICSGFVGVANSLINCPCLVLGSPEAQRRTKRKINEYLNC